jgi:hypothetical protein
MIEGKRPPREDVDLTDSLGEECVGRNEVRGRGGKGGGKKRSRDEKGSGDSAPSQLDDNASTSHVDLLNIMMSQYFLDLYKVVTVLRTTAYPACYPGDPGVLVCLSSQTLCLGESLSDHFPLCDP